MHTFGETGAGVPAFLAKLWRLVDDPETNHLICWSKDGRSFIIQNQAQFARELLPLNYKHNNMASFIRQLNMYGFHKITSIDNGGLKFDRDEMEFSHPFFKRNCPFLLEHIKRKIANTKTQDDKAVLKPEAVTKVLQEVKAMRGRQDSLDSRFSLMKQENEALWREIASLRQKHAKQQQIVNKLIQFLIAMVQPSQNMSGVKRHMQLMINDIPENAKLRKTSECESECGPVIHELGEELLDEVADADSDLLEPISPYARSNATHLDAESPSPSHMERPQSSISVNSQNYEYSNQSAEDAFALGQGNGAVNNTNQRNPSPHTGTVPGVPPGAALIQAVNPDGSKILYHVTEVLDAHPNEGETAPSAGHTTPTYSEENVLTTPLVRQQMARSQLLKQKNKQRHQQTSNSPSPSPGSPYMLSKLMRMSPQPQSQVQQQQPQQQQQKQQKQPQQKEIKIKVEPNIDPMLFLNTYDESRGLTTDPRLISPNLSEDSTQSGIINNPMKVNPLLTSGAMVQIPRNVISGTTTNMYETEDFITENMPNDLFDDSSLIAGNGDNSNFSDNFKMNEQQQFGLMTAKGGNFSSFIAGNNANNANNVQNGNNVSANVASTSTAATSATSTSTSTSLPSTSAAAALNPQANAINKGDSNMAVTKYKNQEDGNPNATREEVNGHLESVQDELESLRELLRGDGYSLDPSVLVNNGQTGGSTNNNGYLTLDTEFLNKLFNDSDILGPYGLAVYPDLPNSLNEKKGSELMTYQPVYDLSDILDKSDLEADTDTMNTPRVSPQLLASNLNSSGLNTPYHE